MPTYEYECKKCGNTFDLFQSMADEPVKICPTCGGDVRRLINGGTGIIFKGSGFYINDSRKTQSSSTVSTDSHEKKGEKKNAAESPAPAAPAKVPS
jgi:putative FmdB family regulatory protein